MRSWFYSHGRAHDSFPVLLFCSVNSCGAGLTSTRSHWTSSNQCFLTISFIFMTNHLMIRYLFSCPVPLLCVPVNRSINCRRLTVFRISFHPTFGSASSHRGVDSLTWKSLPQRALRLVTHSSRRRGRGFSPRSVFVPARSSLKTFQPAWRMPGFLYGSLAELFPSGQRLDNSPLVGKANCVSETTGRVYFQKTSRTP